jgi:predicted CxxxxCH...CXXCH cytochrome family protein
VTDCNNCHTSTSTSGTTINSGSTLHTDGQRQVTIAAAYDSDAVPGNNYTVGSKTCANTTCHGTNAPVWGAALTCNTCHGAPPSGANSGAHAKHEGTVGALPTAYADSTRTSSTKYGIACSTCHAGTHGNGAGAPWTADITTGLGYSGSGSTVSQVEVNGQTFNWTTNKTCATDCHSDGGRMQANGTYVVNRTNPTGWNQTFAAGCTGCHGAAGATTTLSLAHINHVNTGTYSMQCQRCHATTVNAAGAISDFSKHVNLTRDYSGGSYLAGDGTTTIDNSAMVLQANHTCTASYCHSDGTKRTAPFTSTSNAWNAAAPACTNCHATTGLTTGSHASHLAAPSSYGCAVCHSTVAATNTSIAAGGYSLHVDGTPTVSISATYGGTYSLTTKQCTNVACHGTANPTPVWGTATSVTCRGCHGKTTGAADDDVDNWTFASPIGSGIVGATNAMSKIDIDDWTNYGHGRTTALGNYAQSNNVSAKFDGAASGMVPTQDGCNYCHALLASADHDTTMATNPFRLVSTAPKNQVCLNCHDPLAGAYSPAGSGLPTITAATRISALHAGGKHAATDAGNFCWDCHDPHGDYRYTATASPIAFMIHDYPTTANSGAAGWGIPTAIATTALDFRFNLDGAGSTGVFSWGDYATSTLVGVCQVCHTGTAHFTNSTWVTTAGGDSTHNTGQGCTATCHTHQQPPSDAFKGKGSCKGCHAGAQGSGATARTAVVGGTAGAAGDDFIRPSRHVSNGTLTQIVTNVDCIVCHAEGDPAASTDLVPATSTAWHGGDTGGSKNVNLRNVDTGGVMVSWTGTRTVPLANGAAYTAQRDAMDSFCMNCHDADGASAISVNATNTGLDLATTPLAVATGGLVRAGTTVTVTLAAGHGLIVNDRVVLEPGETNFPRGVKQVLTSTATTVTYTEAGTAGASTTPASVTKVAFAAVGGAVRAGTTVTVTTQTAHGFAATNKIAIGPGEMNFPVGIKTIVTAPTATTFTYTEAGTAVASTVAQTFWKTTARALTPFNTADTRANNRDVAALNTLRTTVADVKGRFNLYNQTGKAWASHHNLNQFTKRYTTQNASWLATAWTTYQTKEAVTINGATAREVVGLHCSDCHLNEKNAHGSRSTFYMMSDSAGNDAAFTLVTASNATHLCAKCHNPVTYSLNAVDASSRTGYHGPAGRCNNVNQNNISLLTAVAGTTQMYCLGCHGGSQLGEIHGTNGTYLPGTTGAASKKYRFMGTGGSMRFYSPNGTTTVADPGGWEGTAVPGCYTIGATDTYGGCTKHTGFATAGAATKARLLTY